MMRGSTVLVPGKSHYASGYWEYGRIHSFAHAIETIRLSGAKSVLDVGVGNGFVASTLALLGIEVRTMDLSAELKPDFVGSVLSIPLGTGRFELVSCCQVLEHLPFEDVGRGIKELIRVAQQTVLVSVPDITRCLELGFRLPKVGRRVFQASVPKIPRREISRARQKELGHHWEIGFKDFPVTRFVDLIGDAGGLLDSHWRVSELPWHHFFLIRKAKQGKLDKHEAPC